MMTAVLAVKAICVYTVLVNSFKEYPFVIYEYQKGRNHELPLAFYQDYKGVLVTDELKQYHLLQDKIAGLMREGIMLMPSRLEIKQMTKQ